MATKNQIILIVAFVLIFAGYDPAQQYLPAIYHESGIEDRAFVSLALIYLAILVGAFFAPAVCRQIGLRRSLFFSSLFYPLFILAVVAHTPWILYAASLLLGVAASILWTAHGTSFSKAAGVRVGFYTGLFFSLLSLGRAVTTFLTGLAVERFPEWIIFSALAVLAGVGCVLLLLLSDIPAERVRAHSPFRVVRHVSMLLLIPSFVSASFLSGLFISSIPIHLSERFGLSSVGLISSLFIVLLIGVPFALGPLIDRFSARPFMLGGLACLIVGYLLLRSASTLMLSALGMMLMGIQGGVFFTIGYPLLSRLFKKEVDAALAVRLIFVSAAIVLASLLSIWFSFLALSIVGIALAFLAALSLCVLFAIDGKLHAHRLRVGR